MKNLFKMTITLAISLLLKGCGVDNQNYGETSNMLLNQPITVGEIAYNENNLWGCRLYLEESGEFVPFLVLTSDYNGNCLLLREFLLNDFISYNSSGIYATYYCNSNIDNFLNNDYYLRLSEKTQQLIVTSQIEITSKNAIDTHNNDIEIISRNVFLLSANEVNASISRIALKEGDTLSYFKTIQNRIATYSDCEVGPWLLRTPALRNGNVIMGIADDGSIGMVGINDITGKSESAVRPAFCVSPYTPIVLKNNGMNGEDIFYIK